MSEGTDKDELRQQLRELMDASRREPPLSGAERRRVRELIAAQERWTWLRKKVFVIAPWLIAVLGGIGAGWDHLMRLVGAQT
jgi:hypothetical protein